MVLVKEWLKKVLRCFQIVHDYKCRKSHAWLAVSVGGIVGGGAVASVAVVT